MVVWSIGEVLWDVFPDQERFGGAPLNFCANLQRLGEQTMLLSAVGEDERGRLALERMRTLGLNTDGVSVVAELPTGIATISTGADGEPAFVIPRPAAFDRVSVDPEIFARATEEEVDWLYLGTLLQTEPSIEAFTTDLTEHLFPARVFYDMNLRTGQWNLPLVQRLSELASVVKLNESEAETLFERTNESGAEFTLEEFCRTWSETYGIDVMCVTLGPAGCLVYDARTLNDAGVMTRVPGYAVTVCDTVGSGDAFAAAFLHGYHHGWPMQKTAAFANALGALVASRAGATPPWTVTEVLALASTKALG
jgi:fructokinase